MAATWDIVLISPCFLNMRIEYEKKIGIGMIWSIDDWSGKISGRCRQFRM